MPPAAKRCGQRCGQRCGHHVCSFTAAAPGGQRSRAWLAGVFAAAIQHRHVRDPELHAGVCSCPLRRPGLRGSAPGRSVAEFHSRAFGLQTTPGGVRSGGHGCWLRLRSSGRGEEQDGRATARGNASFCGARCANLPGSEMRDVPSSVGGAGFPPHPRAYQPGRGNCRDWGRRVNKGPTSGCSGRLRRAEERHPLLLAERAEGDLEFRPAQRKPRAAGARRLHEQRSLPWPPQP